MTRAPPQKSVSRRGAFGPCEPRKNWMRPPASDGRLRAFRRVMLTCSVSGLPVVVSCTGEGGGGLGADCNALLSVNDSRSLRRLRRM
eukprot:1959000-Prymnesium_polylepis.1